MRAKRKILIASFFVALMLMLPFTSVAENQVVENFESESEEETLESEELEDPLKVVLRNDEPSLIKALYLEGVAYLEYLIEYLKDKLDQGYTSEMLEAEMENLLSNEEELYSMGLTGATCEYSSNGYGCGTTSYEGEVTGPEVVMETTSGNMGYEVSMEAEAVSGELEYVEIEENIYLYVGGDAFQTDDTNLIQDRLGWINGIIEFNNLRSEYREYLEEVIIPNVTWIEVIEETLAFGGINFDVENFIFNNLQNFLIDLNDYLTSGFPIIHDIIEERIPVFVQALYAKLNQKVGGNIRELAKNVRNALKTFILSFFTIKQGIAPFKAFRQLLRATLKFGFILGIMIVYMNETQIQEYKEDVEEAITNLYNAWVDFFDWLETEPWLEPVHIRGNVTGIEPNRGLWVYCEKDPNVIVITDQDGNFEGLDFDTADEKHPRFIHKCVTTANNTEEKQTVGNSGNKIYDLLLTGTFSGGNLTLIIDFSAEDNNPYVQSENNAAVQEQQGTVEAATEGQTQYS